MHLWGVNSHVTSLEIDSKDQLHSLNGKNSNSSQMKMTKNLLMPSYQHNAFLMSLCGWLELKYIQLTCNGYQVLNR